MAHTLLPPQNPQSSHHTAQALQGPAHRLNNCYGTPPEVSACIQAFFKRSFFDPCPWHPSEDGLLIDWKPSVFLNPPYSAGELDKWEAKASLEISKGNTQEVVWLINYGCTRARKRIAQSSSAIVHLHKRIAFIEPVTKQPLKSNDRDSMLYIWSKDTDPMRVISAFGSLGTPFFVLKTPAQLSVENKALLFRRGRPSPRIQSLRNFRFPFS